MNKIVRHAAICVLASAFAAPLAQAQSYEIRLTQDLGGLNIGVETFDGPAVVVGLQNNSAQDALCTAGYNIYPATPGPGQTVTATVRAGKSGTLAYPTNNFSDIFSTVFVNLTCAAKK